MKMQRKELKREEALVSELEWQKGILENKSFSGK